MKKVWFVKGKPKKGGVKVGWRDNSGHRHEQTLPNKAVAYDFIHRKEQELNENIYPDPIALKWDEFVAEYLKHKKTVQRLATASLRSMRITLKQFRRINGAVQSTKITQRHIDNFIAAKSKTAKAPTVNKDVRNLRTLILWAIEYRYIGKQAERFRWHMQRVEQKEVEWLKPKQAQNLLIAARKYQRYGDAWYIRVLIALKTGLRQGDIERLKFTDIDFEAGTMKTISQKTKKERTRDIDPDTLNRLAEYHASIPEGQDKLFTDKFTSGKWDRIRKEAGLPGFKFHSLRATFATWLAQAGVPEAVIRDLLEHSTSYLTQKVYINTESVREQYRKAVNKLPALAH